MSELFSLDTRLELCAEFVRKGKKIADVGTDHAYLPVFLCLSGKVPSAIAADIAPSPLARGEETVRKYGVQDSVKMRLSAGLENISEDEADDIIIAGMGAETIIEIISAATWLKNPEKKLILQAMSKNERLIEYLCSEGFEIERQSATVSMGKPYTVMLVGYSGKVCECSELFSYIGKLDPKDRIHRQYLEKQVRTLRKRAHADVRFSQIADEIERRFE